MPAYETQVLGLLLNIDLDSLLGVAAVGFIGCYMRAGGVIHSPSLGQAH